MHDKRIKIRTVKSHK